MDGTTSNEGGPDAAVTSAGLPEDVRRILVAVAERSGEHRDVLVRQITRAVVTENARTWVYFSVPDPVARVPWSDGFIPLALNPSVVDASGEPTGTIYVWVEDGRLSGVEHPWFTDEAPTQWPSVDMLVWDQVSIS
ncbi:hypothetical protein J1G42_02035 [Cellulomonas sp. zg-ZUI222]|uniref:GAF domain-containing protein n=1 Tax=Cellulomonas wangleii TaxID=2816956 RepID=A0ABX8D4D0_9CELL|nr:MULTISPECIES: hypothetical protein [Cellulomonas]MBO0898741.1 hypothetical protein [Cellulomonas sp. zg-ZUI22]MBO0919602.1 hypothetical protein [Cellulomonas wangleii]MBO0923971.1 hypothetical protein [Cellulomonas wangleii]MBO0924253.1 hypothetical protein [Cellulomonas wangleii]QVI62264.1 hypothetical protein KG103_17965 [Cellulomonas wangleii]